MKKTKLELLAPAKNLQCGKSAILAGADAVYIGAPKFGARLGAGNSFADIEALVEFAHVYNVKVYVAFNTIIFDNELSEAKSLIWHLYESGIDGLIIQDLGLLELELPPIKLIASTQTNNYDLDRVKFLDKVGFERIILARELSLEQIKKIKKETTAELEFFVHGSLCVSLSGQCYFSQAINGRSANRGFCGQPCRHLYSLKDASGKTLATDKYLLSLKDFNLSNKVSELIKAGITSFKIEGRLKDETYVINTVAAYRQILDELIAEDESLEKASLGEIKSEFKPDLAKSFNRGFTQYFINGEADNILSPDTTKSLGKYLGKVTKVHNNYITLDTKAIINNGDGFCWFTKDKELVGSNVNQVFGEKIYLEDTSGLFFGCFVYRNFDSAFEKELLNKSLERKIKLQLKLKTSATGYKLEVIDEAGFKAVVSLKEKISQAQNIEGAKANFINQLSKLGETEFEAESVALDFKEVPFLPISRINELRRLMIEELREKRQANYARPESVKPSKLAKYPEDLLLFEGNVANELAQKFYQDRGVVEIEPAFEKLPDYSGRRVMTTKHCLRAYFGLCPKNKTANFSIKEPLSLIDDKREYKLKFDCKKCFMEIYWPENKEQADEKKKGK